jgi:predicted AAA+ superfamily ATPase
MLRITEDDIANRMRADNPWWSGPMDPRSPPLAWPRRAYFVALQRLLRTPVNRAVVLLGSRRVGKTTLLRQLIGDASVSGGFGPCLYASVDTPTFTGLRLEELLDLFTRVHPHDAQSQRLVVFDEIQYLPDWERHLKDLVDRYPATRFVASGSAGAALRRKSQESGAGRFTDFELPPLTFAEFLDFLGKTNDVIDTTQATPTVRDAAALDSLFADYVNFGGYPEVVVNESMRSDLSRFVRADIIDKVLLRDLPSLYGISNIPELNRLFTTVAYNTGQIVSLEGLSKGSGISKPTLRKYLEYLEAAFLIVRLRRVDENARRFDREREFKVYLTNPSMRAALFGPTAIDDDAMGPLAETALITQYLHAPIFRDLAFARWRRGEVDLVALDSSTQRPRWALDVKWSEAAAKRRNSWTPLLEFAAANGLDHVHMTGRTPAMSRGAGKPVCVVWPHALLCFQIARLAASEAAVLSRHGLPGVMPS